MRTFAAAALLTAFCLGCSVLPQSKKGGGAMNEQSSGIALEGKFTVTDARLEIAYSISNRGTNAVYVLDTAVHIDSHGVASAGPATPRIDFVPPGLAVLSDKLFPLPPGTRTAAPPSAYGDRLAPGSVKHGTVSLELPLRDYSARGAGPFREVSCERVRFIIGAIADSPDLHADQQLIAGATLWHLSAAAWGLQHEAVIEAGVSPPVRVIVRD